ncbi:hypothetical protein [Streptomyces sp. NPDC020747]
MSVRAVIFGRRCRSRAGLASAVDPRRRFRAHPDTTPGARRRTFGET